MSNGQLPTPCREIGPAQGEAAFEDAAVALRREVAGTTTGWVLPLMLSSAGDFVAVVAE